MHTFVVFYIVLLSFISIRVNSYIKSSQLFKSKYTNLNILQTSSLSSTSSNEYGLEFNSIRFSSSTSSNSMKPLNERNVITLVNRITEAVDNTNNNSNNNKIDPVWETIKYEALSVSENDMKTATLMANSILSQPSFKEAVIDYVANQLESPLLASTQIKNIFEDVCEQNSTIPTIWAFDLLSFVLKKDGVSGMFYYI